MSYSIRQVEQHELSRRDLYRLAFLPYDYTAHQVAVGYARHWAIVALALASMLAAQLAWGSPLLAAAAAGFVPLYTYAHSRAFDWLVIQRSQPDYWDFAGAWRLPHRVYVAECDSTKKLIGAVCLQHRSDSTCDLQHAAVIASRRRSGVGSRLVRLALAEAARLGYSRVTLYSTTAQAPAVAMYQRLGIGVDRVHSEGVSKRIPLLPKPFCYVNMSVQLGDLKLLE